MHLVRLVVLGSPGVGKTTLIENFLSNCVLPLQPSMQSPETGEGCRSYDCSVLLNDLIVQVKIIDVPPVSFFPPLASSSLDWTDREGIALKSADGFILVFDLTSPGSYSFQRFVQGFVQCFIQAEITVFVFLYSFLSIPEDDAGSVDRRKRQRYAKDSSLCHRK